jgi:hypothetical protein
MGRNHNRRNEPADSGWIGPAISGAVALANIALWLAARPGGEPTGS